MDDDLLPGQIYQWEVEARLAGGDRVTVSPSASFWVLDKNSLHDVETVEQGYKSSALVLSIVYAKYGLHDEALVQIKQLQKLNPTSRSVKKMLRKLEQFSKY